jgi:excinuclease UvrABC nuclease subunit
VTDSEVEALVLECNLIKEYRPKYNTMLMDDKAYPFIKVTVEDPFPEDSVSHHMKKDKARYFGPVSERRCGAKETIDLIRRLYHLRELQPKASRGTSERSGPVCIITFISARRPVRAGSPRRRTGSSSRRRLIF